MTRLYLRSSVAAGQPRPKGDGLEKRLLLAAEAGDARSQCNLGILYGNGLDDNGYAVEGNRPEAVRWLLAAAEQGLPRAQVKLAEVYADAPDISNSHAAACGWFLLAALGLRGIHLHRARSGYERTASHLTPAQIAEARRFARDWTPKLPKQAASLPPEQTDAGGVR
jgi:TPR repeat protein